MNIKESTVRENVIPLLSHGQNSQHPTSIRHRGRYIIQKHTDYSKGLNNDTQSGVFYYDTKSS